MTKKKILYVVHNHPSGRPGGAETYALELYEAMRESAAFTPLLLAKSGPPLSTSGPPHGGTLLSHVNRDPNQYFLHTDNQFDWFNGVLKDKAVLTRFFREFLQATRPDLVHFQHTLFFGYDMIREVRNTLPNAAIVYTLHEYLPICHRQGQMLRTGDNRPCLDASPRCCHECFPQFAPQDFFLRKRLVQSQFALVDRFIAPSRFLLERYVDWGLARERIAFEEYGRQPMSRAAGPARAARNRFAFFGQISPFKGVDVLLEAMRMLAETRAKRFALAPGDASPDPEPLRPRLSIHGGNLDLQETKFQDRVRDLLAVTRPEVTLAGRYFPAQLPGLLAETDWVVVPSIWWENSPLVIQEAFGYGRPVICSNIGGMAEKVRHGVDGLHFQAGDPASLAETMGAAAGTPGMWEQLAANLPPVYPMSQHVSFLTGLYREVLEAQSKGRTL